MEAESVLRSLAAAARAWRDPEYGPRKAAVRETLACENRFTEQALAFAINQQMHEVNVASLARWIGSRSANPRVAVGVLGAGNVPLASFQDFLAVTISGHRYVGCESSRSPALLPAFARDVTEHGGPEFEFTGQDRFFEKVGVVVASGSDETMDEVAARCDGVGILPGRRLLRGTRIGVALLDGRETEDQRIRWAEDVLLHEGLGCRNVAIAFAPASLDAGPYFEALAVFRGTFPAHPRTVGNLKMQQAFLKAVSRPHAHGDGFEFLVSRGEAEIQAPGHLRWTPYDRIEEVTEWLRDHAELVQIASARPSLFPVVPEGVDRCPLGDTQRPPLDWRPDGIDTLDFLTGITPE